MEWEHSNPNPLVRNSQVLISPYQGPSVRENLHGFGLSDPSGRAIFQAKGHSVIRPFGRSADGPKGPGAAPYPSSPSPSQDGVQALRDVCIQLARVGGTFVQSSENPATRRKSQESGRFAWVRPDRLWWQYDRPETKIFVWTPERMEFYVEADCIVYYESQPQARLQAHPLLAFVRDCDFSGLTMELRQFEAKPDEARWVFEAPPTAETDPRVPWSRVVIQWRSRAPELVVETTDWLRQRVEYRLRIDARVWAEADRNGVWHVQFPATCERVPLSELGQ